MDIREVAVPKILNSTSIDLGEYVINPYKGCQYACLYCYVRHNKAIRNEKRCWGEYIDIRANAPQLLEKELFIKKPQRVFLGSTTECFQPIEKECRLTYRILEILNKNKVYYSILTRSPLILEYIPLLKVGYCESIYFTINSYERELKKLLEPYSAPFFVRINAVNKLLEEEIPVVPYFAPLLPYVSDTENIFLRFKKSDRVDFEGLNFNLGNIDRLIDVIGSIYPELKQKYKRMATDAGEYNNVWRSIKKDVVKEAIKAKKNHRIYVHRLNSYFENSYRNNLK